MKYRKKPVTVEAIQFFDTVECVMELSVFMGKTVISYENPKEPKIKIETLEGTVTGIEGCYIIKGVNGEFYPCKQDIFKKTYELVE